MKRSEKMKKIRMVSFLFGLALTLCVFGVANATLVTFDDIGVPNDYYPHSGPPYGFVDQGFRFSNPAVVIDISASSTWHAEGPAYSGNYAMLDIFSTPAIEVTVVGGGTFSVTDFYARGWYTYKPTISVSGFLNGNIVGSPVTANLLSSQWQDVVLNFANIDTLQITATSDYYFLVDNLTVNAGTTTPEPATMLLLGIGLVGLAGVRRKFKQ
jgi:hypothetical protein